MDEAQADDHQHHVGRIDVEVLAKAVDVGKRDVAHAQADDGIDQEVVELDGVEGGIDERHAMA